MAQPIPGVQLEALAQRFVRFADQECVDYAPLYDRLARGIARDPELLTIAAYARSGQQAPNLLRSGCAPWIWPEHPERAAVLQQVLALAQHEPPTLLAGDALTVLPQAVAEAPTDAILCVFRIATLAHFPPEARERLRLLLPELARQRDLFWLSSEGVGLGESRQGGEYVTMLTAFLHGHRTERRAGRS